VSPTGQGDTEQFIISVLRTEFGVQTPDDVGANTELGANGLQLDSILVMGLCYRLGDEFDIVPPIDIALGMTVGGLAEYVAREVSP